MRILLANYRYFLSGGPERYMFNVSDALIRSGHDVVPFSIQYARNVLTPYSNHFATPIGTADEVYFRQQRQSIGTAIKTLERLFYSPEVEKKVLALAREVRPDVAYVLHYLRKLSPSLLVGLKQAKLPILVRLSDYQMSCPQAHFLRDSKPCSLCAAGNVLPSIRYRCVQGSLSASVANAFATWFHRAKGYFDLIDCFVVTNGFMADILRQGGVSSERVSLIPTFVQPRVPTELLIKQKRDQVAYVGRLEHIKGVHVLIEAAGILKVRFPEVGWSFRIAGEGSPDYVAMLQRRMLDLDLSGRVEFCGPLDTNDVFDLLATSRIQVVPSLWFENLPNSLLEGYASCTPAIASALGSLTATVEHGRTGMLFAPGDASSLAEALAECWANRGRLDEMGRNARLLADTVYSEQGHLEKLTALFSSLVRSK